MTENVINQDIYNRNQKSQFGNSKITKTTSILQQKPKNYVNENETGLKKKESYREAFKSIGINKEKSTSSMKEKSEVKNAIEIEDELEIEFMPKYNHIKEAKKEEFPITFYDENNELQTVDTNFEKIIPKIITKPIAFKNKKKAFDSKKRLKIYKDIEDDLFKFL
jgi:hypothetical protein